MPFGIVQQVLIEVGKSVIHEAANKVIEAAIEEAQEKALYDSLSQMHSYPTGYYFIVDEHGTATKMPK